MAATYPAKHLDLKGVPVTRALNGVDHILIWNGGRPHSIALKNVMQSQTLSQIEVIDGNIEISSDKIHDAYLIMLSSGTNAVKLPTFEEPSLNCSIKLTLINPKTDQAFVVFDGGNASVLYEDPFDFALSNDGKNGVNRYTQFTLSYVPLGKEPIWLVKRIWYRP